ncbi:MAG: PorT family protein [Cytophagales bacterium]|nr:PorT family protein [Cytophagales bacterium]
MKKLLIFFTLSFLLANVQANAQKTNFGIKGGFNISKMHASADGEGQGSISSDSRIHIALGLYSQAQISTNIPNLFFQTELLLSLEGGNGANEEMNTTFINLPLLIKYYLQENKGFYLEAGPQFSFLLSTEMKANGESYDLTDEMNRFNLGLSFGLGYELSNGIGFDGRYNLGLTRLNKDDGDLDMTSRTFQLTVSYRI